MKVSGSQSESFCGSGRCKCNTGSGKRGCNVLCSCGGSAECFPKQQSAIVDSVNDISLDDIPESPTKRVRFCPVTDDLSSDSESVDKSYLEAISSSSDEALIHLPVVFSSRRLTLQQNRRMAPAPPVIEPSREIDISHFVTQSEHMNQRFVLPFFVALAVMNLPVSLPGSVLETQQAGGGAEQVETNNNHTRDHHYDDSLSDNDLDAGNWLNN